MWWQLLFWALLVPCLIILGIVYGTSKRLYKLFQILATFTYVIFIAYIIDVFSLGRNWILGLLLFSAALMLLLGYRMTKRQEGPGRKEKRPAPTKRNLILLAILIAVMLLLILLGALRIGVSREISVLPSIAKDALLAASGSYEYQMPSVALANITYSNTFFLPYVVPDQYFAACFRDSASGALSYEQLEVQVDGQPRYGDQAFDEVAPYATETRHISVVQRLRPIVEKGAPAPQEPFRNYDAIVLVSDDVTVNCEDIPAARAKGELSLDATILLE